MNDLGTISLLVDVRGRPMVTGLANDLNQVAVAEAKVSAATQKVMADLQRTRDIMANLKKATDDTGVAFQRFSAKELQQTSQQLKKFETRLATTRRGMGQMGMATQQVGYQVGDFLVQVQSGTNFMVAFGQQATQLVGILPAFSKQLGMSVGSLIGISSVLGIAIPLVTAIGAAFMRTSQEVKEGADKQKQAYDAVKESIESLQLARQMASSGAQTESEQTVLNALNTALEERKRLLAEALALEVENTNEYSLKEAAARGELAVRQQANRIAIRENEEILKALAYERELEVAARRRANDRRNEYREEQAEKEALIAAQTQQLEVIGRTQAEAKILAEAASQAGVSAQQLSHIDFSNISTAATEALRLAGNLGISLDTASRLAALGPQGIGGNDPSGGTYSGRGALSQSDILGMRTAGTFGYTTPPDNSKGKGGGGKGDPLEQLRQQIALENELLGVSDAQARVIKALGQDRSKYSEAEINAITAEIEAYNQKQEAIERTKQIMDTVKSSMEEAFMSMVDGTMSAKDAFRSMAAEIIKELYRVLVVQQLVNSISGAIGGIFGGSSAPTSSPRPMPRPSGVAVGGSIMAGGSYLVGENGPELVIPRHSGTVVNANQTAAMGGNSGAVTVQNNITVTGSDAAMVRTEIAKMIPQITNATKAAVIDAKQRGGQMAAAFR